jgi:hypothetical protein
MQSFQSVRYAAALLILLLTIGLAVPYPALGQMPGNNPAGKDWTFFIMPYLWMTGINGDVTVKGFKSHVDVDFSDIIKHFDFGGEVHIEAMWKSRYGFFIDPTYIKLSSKKDIALPNGGQIDKITEKQWLVEAGGVYRLGEWPGGRGMKDNRVALDALVGGRYMSTDVDIKLKNTTPTHVGGDKDWLDLFVGGRLIADLTKNVPFSLRTDIGGFGFGFSSDIAWNLVSYIGYKLPWYGITPAIGYRVLYVDYKDGSGNNRFVYDTWTHGPILGLAFQF